MSPRAVKASSSTVPNQPKSLREHLEQVPQHGSTTDVVTDALREAILDGSLPPSAWLREDDLAAQLRVSRTPVREALRRLGDEHLTVRVAHRGSMVAPMTLDDVLAVYAVREALESLAARITATRRPAGIVESLVEVNNQMSAAVKKKDFVEARRLNFKFHRLLREGTGNPYLQRFLLQVEHAVRRFGVSTIDAPGRAAEMIAGHQGIIEAVASGDPDSAAQRATELVRRDREVRIQQISGL
jgi:DNA-binding GntR family transcriptional regulator